MINHRILSKKDCVKGDYEEDDSPLSTRETKFWGILVWFGLAELHIPTPTERRVCVSPFLVIN